MFYTAKITKEGKHWLAEFVDAPGCQTYANSKKALEAAAEEALVGWLEANLVSGQAPSEPARKAPHGANYLAVRVPLDLTVALWIRWGRLSNAMTQGQLAKLARVSQQQIAKLEKPGENPSIRTLEKVAKALGRQLEVSFEVA